LVSLTHKYQIYLHPSLFIGEKRARPTGTCRGGLGGTRTRTRTCCALRPTTPSSSGAAAGASAAQYAPERIALYDRANMYSGLGAGRIGVDLGCYTDGAPEQRKEARYVRTPQETQRGMTTWDRQDRPLAREFRKLSGVVVELDLAGLQPTPAEVGILIAEEWAKPHGRRVQAAERTPARSGRLRKRTMSALP
jgi:hypothetical protein